GLIGGDLRLSHDGDADAVPSDTLGGEAHPDDERASLDEVERHTPALSFPPASRVVAVVAVVAHHPNFARLDLIERLVFAAPSGSAREARLAIRIPTAAAPVASSARTHGVVEERQERLAAEVLHEQIAAVLREGAVAPGVLVHAYFALRR